MSDNPFEEGNAEPNPFQVRARSLDLDARARPPFKRARPSSVAPGISSEGMKRRGGAMMYPTTEGEK